MRRKGNTCKGFFRLRNDLHFAFKILFKIRVKSLVSENRFSSEEGNAVEMLKLFSSKIIIFQNLVFIRCILNLFLKFPYIFPQMYLHFWLEIYKISEGFI